MMRRAAKFSADGQYRYLLTRVWDEELPVVTFIGLNPSAADDTDDDATTKRCIQFAKTWRFGGIKVVNLFAYISTDRSVLKGIPDPVGARNNQYIVSTCKESDLVVVAWGNDGTLLGRASEVRKMLPIMMCLDINKSGEPKHPLYVKGDVLPYLYLKPPVKKKNSGSWLRVLLDALHDDPTDVLNDSLLQRLAEVEHAALELLVEPLSVEMIGDLVFLTLVLERTGDRPSHRKSAWLIDYLFTQDQRLGRIVKACADEMMACDPPSWDRWQEVKALLLERNP